MKYGSTHHITNAWDPVRARREIGPNRHKGNAFFEVERLILDVLTWRAKTIELDPEL